jgi:hypothetical protein
MITDDPETPGNRQWEINVAGTLERSSGENLWEFPALDLNYGLHRTRSKPSPPPLPLLIFSGRLPRSRAPAPIVDRLVRLLFVATLAQSKAPLPNYR